jgi:pimeloyl-ACP methyl ester carboxylesterase
MEQQATIGGRTIRYLDAGSGVPLILLHAFPLGAEMWRPQLDAVPAGYRAVAPDLRGFGGTSREASGAVRPADTMDEHAADVLALADRLGFDRFVLGGLSMGGYVAFATLRRAPERVAGLLLADTRAEADTAEARANRERMLDALQADGVGAVVEAMLPKLLAPETRRDRPGVERFVRELIAGNRDEGVADAIRALMSRPDSTPLLGTIGVPTHLVVGREDELTPPVLHEQMQARIPGAGLTIVERAGHLSNLEQPDVFNRALARFVEAFR